MMAGQFDYVLFSSYLLKLTRGSEFKKKGAGKGKKGKGKPAAQNRNKKPAVKSPRKSGKKKVKI